MKIINKKIVVASMATIAGIALVGSVTGAVAWYQYSTRSTAAYIGTTAHCSESLQIKNSDASGAWASDLESNSSTSTTAQKIVLESGTGENIVPITSGPLADKATITPTDFYANPVYQDFEYGSWQKVEKANYTQFKVQLRVLDVNGNTATPTYLAKDVYLSDVTISNTNNTKSDLTSAVRVHVSCGTNNVLFSTSGGNTNTNGTLDLNGDGVLDYPKHTYEWGDTAASTYGEGVQVSDKNDTTSAFIVDDSTADFSTISKTALGTTSDSGAGLEVTVTIWLEGWQELSSNAVWDAASYVGASFNVGLSFAVPLHASNE